MGIRSSNNCHTIKPYKPFNFIQKEIPPRMFQLQSQVAFDKTLVSETKVAQDPQMFIPIPEFSTFDKIYHFNS